MRRIIVKSIVLCVLGLGFSALLNAQASKTLQAEAVISACRPDGNISGKATLVEKVSREGIKEVAVRIEVQGLKDGRHAVIIHDNEDTYCPDGVTKGCAGGSRAACGIIQLTR